LTELWILQVVIYVSSRGIYIHVTAAYPEGNRFIDWLAPYPFSHDSEFEARRNGGQSGSVNEDNMARLER